MSYLINQARIHSLTINGTDYTSSLITWQCSDSSAQMQGIVATTGQLILGQVPGGYETEDYDRDNFKRGNPVILQMTYPGGAIQRHPRGLLYVISVSYSPENDELTVEIGCRLALAALTENISEIESLAPIYLDPTQKTYQGIAASFASAGMYLFQDNTGALVSDRFFESDNDTSFAAGEWTSILGVTALKASPLAAARPVPDQIEISYQVPVGEISSDKTGTVDLSTVESYYYITYPAIVYQRVGSGLGNISGTSTGTASSGKTSSCGNTPPKPADNGTPSCNEGYELVEAPEIIPVTSVENSRTEYSGPAAQVSRIYTERRGPAIEVNGQYFADKYAYCRYTWGTACQPNGGCEMSGTENILQQYTEQINYYGPANELIRTITDTYQTVLSGAQPFNWRSGVVNGAPQNFQTIDSSQMYRSSREMVEHFYLENGTKQETTRWESVTSRQSGITGNIDALSGIRTFQRRTSTTITANPVIPDTLNSATTSTESKSTTVLLAPISYDSGIAVSGPYRIKYEIPVPLLSISSSEIDQILADFSGYIKMFTKGDTYGVQLSEALRSDIAGGYRPGMPFRFYDASNGKLLAMRMDATTWGVASDGAVLTTNGIWMGESNGTPVTPSNLVGNSTPNLGGGSPTPPGGSVVPPSVSGESSVNAGAVILSFDVFLSLNSSTEIMENLPASADAIYQLNIPLTMTCWAGGLVVGPGQLVTTDPGGSIPAEYGGSIVASGATIVQANIFG